MTFYDRLSMICKDRGLSVSALCKRIGLNPTTGATWKKRGSIPKGDTLKAIADELDVDTFWFFVEPDDFILSLPLFFMVCDVLTQGFSYKPLLALCTIKQSDDVCIGSLVQLHAEMYAVKSVKLFLCSPISLGYGHLFYHLSLSPRFHFILLQTGLQAFVQYP